MNEDLLFYFILFYFILFLITSSSFLQPSHYPPCGLPSHSSSFFHAPSPRGCTRTLTPYHHPARPLHSLGPQVSQGLGDSLLTEARPGSPLLYMCVGPQTSLVYAA